MDFGGVVEQVIECVAASARDHDDAAFVVESHEFAVDARILPAGIVDEIAPVDPSKGRVLGAVMDPGGCDGLRHISNED
jgi:hypothetical protein